MGIVCGAGESVGLKWIDLFEAIFLAGMYEDFARRAHAEGRPFTISRGKFVRDLGFMLDIQMAHQSNGHAKPREPLIKVVSS